MNPSNLVTTDHVSAFFSLNKIITPIADVSTMTGGFGIDNRDKCPPAAPLGIRSRGGTEYAAKYIEQEAEDNELPQRQTVDLPGGSTVSLNLLGNFDKVEELTSTFGEMPCIHDLDAERAEELYLTYYSGRKVIYDPALPITSYKDRILNRIDSNQVVVIQGSTGCGKSTQVPQYIMDHCYNSGRYCNIVVTQPRKIAAISVARRVCQERGWDMGTIVGYQVAMDNKISHDTRLSFVTTGVLLQKLVNCRRMSMYTHVILDEVHERDQDTDFALLVVKKLLRTNSKTVKVILMSATIDTDLFARYFAFPVSGLLAPVVGIEGKPKEVKEHYLHELAGLGVQLPQLDFTVPSIPEASYDLAVRLMFVFDQIEKREQRSSENMEFAIDRGSVLIFLPGYEEIAKMTSKLEAITMNKKLWILPLHSSITIEEQGRVFKKPPSEFRKVIISTNIAESSITVPDIKYVIDFCLTKSLVSDPETNYTCLQLEWASKANCTQRKGRAGRVNTGRVYRMVPYKFYEQLNEYCTPEMKRCPLQQTILFAKKLNFGEPQALLALALEPPTLTDIEKSILSLKEIGGLARTVNGRYSPFDGDLTFLGRVMSILPLDACVSKLILLGYVFNCLEDCLIIGASLSHKSFLSRPFRKMLDAYKSRLAWAEGTFSDCFVYLHAYKVWKEISSLGRFRGSKDEAEWGQSNFIQIKRIIEVDMLIKEMVKRLETVNIKVNYQKHGDPDIETQLLKIIIAGAFFPNYFVQSGSDERSVLREVNSNDPLSTICLTGLPSNQGILYAYAIKDMLWCCSPQMSIDFEEKKAFVTFIDSVKKETTKVSHAVYMAVKMRQLGTPLQLRLFDQNDAERKMIQLRAMKSTSNEKLLSTNRMNFQSKSTMLNQIALPPIGTLTVPIFITHIIDCGHFWARYLDTTYQNILGLLSEMINGSDGKNVHLLTKPLKLGMLVLAPYREDAQRGPTQYFRARLDEMNMKGRYVTIFFVDYGNTMENVSIDVLRQINERAAPDVLTTPGLAFECCLSEVKPSAALSSTGMWSRGAIDFFSKNINGQQLTAKVYSVVQNTVRIELFSSRQPESINSLLIEKKFAEHMEESLASRQNNELRMKCEQLAIGIPLDHKDSVVCQYTVDDTFDVRNLLKSAETVRLNGPFSPLEVWYQGLTRLGSFRSVNIERESVNSVSLNPEPQDSEAQMLVGCHINLNPNGSSLSVHNTTLMPKIRGLPSVLCLLFSPYAELRCDHERKKYIGALCGLGFDPETGESMYPEHEIEIAFNTVIDTGDIIKVNKVRSIINILLGHDQEVADVPQKALGHLQRAVRSEIYDLLHKPRKPCTPVPYPRKHAWQQIPPEYLLSPPKPDQEVSCPVLPLHYGIALAKDVSMEMKLKIHIRDLYAKATAKPHGSLEQECKLCSVVLYSVQELRLHLGTPQHMAKEDELVD